MRTFACSETQKFGHVTFFWNGNRSGYFDESLETYLEIPSDKVTHSLTHSLTRSLTHSLTRSLTLARSLAYARRARTRLSSTACR